MIVKGQMAQRHEPRDGINVFQYFTGTCRSTRVCQSHRVQINIQKNKEVVGKIETFKARDIVKATHTKMSFIMNRLSLLYSF